MTNHLSFYLSLNILLIIIGHNLLVVIFNFMLNHSYGKEKQLKENRKKLLNGTIDVQISMRIFVVYISCVKRYEK